MTTVITDNPADTIEINGVPVNVGARISLNPNVPPAAMDLLLDLVAWARREDNPKFAAWGDWNQTSWAAVTLDGDLEDPLRDLRNQAADLGYAEEDGIRAQAEVLVESSLRAGHCRSAFCMAGQAIYQAGYRMILGDSPIHSIGDEVYADDCIAEYDTGRKDERGFAIWADREDADVSSIDSVAREVLGLTEDEASALFNGDNGITTIMRVVNSIAVHRGLPEQFAGVGLHYDDDDTDDDDTD